MEENKTKPAQQVSENSETSKTRKQNENWPYKPAMWKPGQSGNPKGRPSAGSSIKEKINEYIANGLNESELRVIARNKTEPAVNRIAAERVLRSMEFVDVEAFQDVVDGSESLSDVKKRGVNTDVVKRIRVKTKRYQKDGEDIEEAERELEFRDTSGSDFDRIVVHTDGKPTQAVQVTGDLMPSVVTIITPLTRKMDDSQVGPKPSDAP